jgi:hypothetical protein
VQRGSSALVYFSGGKENNINPHSSLFVFLTRKKDEIIFKSIIGILSKEWEMD